MQRYFTKNLDINNKKALLESSDFHHLKNVMRARKDDEIIVCNLQNHCFLAKVEVFDDANKEVLVNLFDELPNNELPVQIDLAQGLIRRERFEYVLQKSTELGVRKILPVISKYSIIKLSNKEEKKIQRWNKITKEASEQSHRNTLVTVDSVKHTFKEIDFSEYDQVLIAYEKENNSKNLANGLEKDSKKILIVIGPEGGLHEDEIAFFQTLPNSLFVGLGKRILRSETASSYLLSVLGYIYEIGDLS